MAAQSTWRRCACGCGASIDDRPTKSTGTRACQRRADDLRRKGARKAGPSKENYVRKFASRVRNRVLLGEPPTRRQSPCATCCGMPWARRTDRFTEGREGYEKPVSEDGWRCRGCGEPYSPEPPPERQSVIGSSAGIAAARGSNYKTIIRGGK